MVKKIGTISKKIIIIMIIFQTIFIPISNAAFWEDIIDTGGNFISTGNNIEKTNSSVNDAELQSTIKDIYNALLALGVVFSVIVGAVLGIKYMIGSVDEQAKTKELLFPYITGCIVIFGAFGIWRIVINVLSKV